jgi:hypothetical protein
MFTEVCTAAEQRTLLPGCLLKSALLQKKAGAAWMFTDVSTAAERSTLLMDIY